MKHAGFPDRAAGSAAFLIDTSIIRRYNTSDFRDGVFLKFFIGGILWANISEQTVFAARPVPT